MTNREAIERIKDHMRVHKIGEYPHIYIADALNMAIAALESPRDWTPCADGVPPETDKYWVTVFYYGELFVEDRDYFAHEKYWGQGLKPAAWMPKFKPAPYRADDTTGKVKEDADDGK